MGRGLAALLPSSSRALESLRQVPLSLVRPNPRQPRRRFDREPLVALAESIRARGVLQPIVVRPLGSDGFELVAGERRLRAAEMAELETVPAIVRETEQSAQLELALIENMAREDLNPVEEARACSTLVQDLGVTKEELGRRVGRSRVAVSNLVRLLDLPDEVLELIEVRELSEGHGRALLLRRDQADRRRLGRDAAAGGWSVRETERRAKAAERGAKSAEEGSHREQPHPDLLEGLAAAEDALAAALGHGVRVLARGSGCRVQIDLGSPHEGVELAERLLRRTAA